jgi:hypothetical protein
MTIRSVYRIIHPMRVRLQFILLRYRFRSSGEIRNELGFGIVINNLYICLMQGSVMHDMKFWVAINPEKILITGHPGLK